MSVPRRVSRRVAFETLFELEARPGSTIEDALEHRGDDLLEHEGRTIDESSVHFIRSLVEGALARRAEIDRIIQANAPAFPIEQMAVTDRVALELGVLELVFQRESAVSIVINEAVELAKTYGGENSGRFVNGVLGTIAGDLPAGSDVSPRT